jgi:putative flippase GtrA
MVLFFGIAALANFAGLLGGPMLIKWFGIPTWMSQGTFVFTSFLVNFLCRKFFIFHK